MGSRRVLREIQIRRLVESVRDESNVESFLILRMAFGGLRGKIFRRYSGVYRNNRELAGDIDSIFWETICSWDETRNKSAMKYIMSMLWNNVYKFVRKKFPFENIKRKGFRVTVVGDMNRYESPGSGGSDRVVAAKCILESLFGDRAEKVFLFLLEVDGRGVNIREFSRIIGVKGCCGEQVYLRMIESLKTVLSGNTTGNATNGGRVCLHTFSDAQDAEEQ